MNMKKLGIWFPTVRCGTGTDVFTINLVEELNKRGIRAEITWLPLRAEYAPWSVPIPKPPNWATVIHVNTWLHSRFLPKNIPIVATIHHSIHDPNFHKYKSKAQALYHKYWIAPNERRVIQQATQVTAVSKFVSDVAKQTLYDAPIQVIYNGIDTQKFTPNPNIYKPNKPFRLLYVGGWKKLKGIDLLPIIMKELGDDFALYYTGGTAAKKDKANMPPNMHDIGKLNQQQVIEQMQKADAFLFPSMSEGFGLVLIEAMACGIPVITSNIKVFLEIVNNYETGILCEYNNADAFITQIKTLSNDLSFHTQLSQNCCSLAKKKYNNRNLIEEYINLYNNL